MQRKKNKDGGMDSVFLTWVKHPWSSLLWEEREFVVGPVRSYRRSPLPWVPLCISFQCLGIDITQIQMELSSDIWVTNLNNNWNYEGIPYHHDFPLLQVPFTKNVLLSNQWWVIFPEEMGTNIFLPQKGIKEITSPIVVKVSLLGSLTGAWMAQRQHHHRKAHPSMNDHPRFPHSL